MAGSALVAALVGIPPGEAGTLLAVITLAALVVVAAGLGLQRQLRRRRAKVARQGALSAAVTAVVALVGLWAVSTQMLVSNHDLAVVLASLPVAAGAGWPTGWPRPGRSRPTRRPRPGRRGGWRPVTWPLGLGCREPPRSPSSPRP
jgi:hypothetical protein